MALFLRKPVDGDARQWLGGGNVCAEPGEGESRRRYGSQTDRNYQLSVRRIHRRYGGEAQSGAVSLGASRARMVRQTRGQPQWQDALGSEGCPRLAGSRSNLERQG